EAITVAVPGSGCRCGVIVAGGQGTHGSKTAYAQGRYGGLGSARHHDISIAVFDQTCRIAYGMQAGCASRYNRVAGALQAQHDGQLSGNKVDQRCRYKERGNTTWTALEVFDLGFFDAGQTTYAGTDDRTDAL